MVCVCCVWCYRFSGLRPEDFASVTTTLEQVQQDMLGLVASETILLGHSLESDLRALKVSWRHSLSLLLPYFLSHCLPLLIYIPLPLLPTLLPPQIIHSSVVDTAIVFPHRRGPPLKRALRTLMKEYMKKFIQDDVGELMDNY